jgi:transposase-like protein
LKESGLETGEFELDESYFGAKRLRGKRGRGAAGKTPVFGLLKRGGKVFGKVVPNCSKDALMPIIQGRILEGSTIHTDGWKAYDGLILNSYNIIGCFIRRMNLQEENRMSTGLNRFERSPKDGSQNSTVAIPSIL